MGNLPDEESALAEVLPGETSSREAEPGLPEVGQWYWVREESHQGGTDEPQEWLGCVVHVGSNYAKLAGPGDRPSCSYSRRVHHNVFRETCRLEPRASEVIASRVAEQREVIAGAVRQIGELTARLQLGDSKVESRELATYRGDDMLTYSRDLQAAKKEGLPELKSRIEAASEVMRSWMQAESIPIRASTEVYDLALAKVEKRIGGVELYAGLVEECVRVRDGATAPPATPLHLWQRRHYMDEECLANYAVGGMTFENLEAFEAWLLEEENLTRILPERRCAVAFRVRRERKEGDGGLAEFVNLLFDQQDENMRTYLYLRNGEQVWRMSTAIDFGERLFPDMDHQLMTGDRVYAIKPWSEVERLATEGEYLDVCRRAEACEAELAALPEDTDLHTRWKVEAKYRDRYAPRDYVLWDRSSVYYDDITDHVKRQMEDHNRLVLVLQGLFDRSEALSPHPPYKLWVPADFETAIRLVRDDSRALPAAELPDFEAYRAECNRRMRPGSMAVGQEDAWLVREAAKYNERVARELRGPESRYAMRRRYQPEGDPGPGVVARVVAMSSRGCSFTWSRRSTRDPGGWRGHGEVRDKIVVPLDHLLCVDAYHPGDYKRFYADPRTRAEYLKWAPLLLRAEEWCTGQHRENPR